ncbi:type II secretion system F family protein [Janibacter sp. DB-40]|uniref:type II secretion system F family protein n=1 Tax=Janibacter sp. DB-40 TaxID=3028808 RepID=UPI002405B657|nr:type II secretion system F family protein [Janibacter sp. DB-40]
MSLLVVTLVLAAALCWPGRAAAAGVPGTEPRLRVRWRSARHGAPLADLEGLARVADLLAMTLRSGATPTTAVRVVAGESPQPWAGVLADVHEQLSSGGRAGEVWRTHALQRPELNALAGAWALSEDLGVALAPSMTTSAQVLRAQVQARRRLDAATSGARATMRMLTLLPLVGTLAGLTFGLAPWEVYGHSVVTMVSAAVGLGLTGVGWLVCRWVLARAVAAEVHR